MNRRLLLWPSLVVGAFIGGVALSAQVTAFTSKLDPRDAVLAAPKNHKVLFENDQVRLLEVTGLPGETENPHIHQYSSVIVFNASAPSGKYHLIGGATREIQRNHLTGDVPLCTALGPEPEHQGTNTDTFPVHFFRLEVKNMEGDEIMKRKTY